MNKKNKNVTSEMDIKGLIIIVCVLVVIAVVAYLLTVGAQKLGWFDEGYYKPEVPEAVISYDNINAGTIFNRKDKEYYVLIADFSDKESVYVNSLGSLYKEKEDSILGKQFKKSKDMPILEDLYNILGQDKKTKRFQTKLIPFVKGSMKFFNNYTNLELKNDLIIADVYDLGEENLKYGMYLFTDIFWDKIKENRNQKKAIYLDEIWRLIGVTSNKEVASFIYKIFKTIRKYGGSGVAITQDISDIFSLENGTYGKSILNNSSIKTFFALEEENIKILSEYSNLSEKEKVEIKSLKRGECLMFVGDEHILTKIECSELEKNIDEGKK